MDAANQTLLLEDSDEALMLRYRANDAAAFDTLYAKHRAPLFRYVTRQISDRAAAEEAFQEIWMNVIASRENYQATALFRTWLYTLAHHRVMDYFRQHRRAVLVAFTSDDDELAPGETIAASRVEEPDIKVQSREQALAILRLVDALPAPQREVFLLSEEAGLSIAEIAETTGATFEAAKSRLRYALKKLREGLEHYR